MIKKITEAGLLCAICLTIISCSQNTYRNDSPFKKALNQVVESNAYHEEEEPEYQLQGFSQGQLLTPAESPL